MSDEEIAITFSAIFAKAITLADGGWRLSLDLSEHEGKVIAEIVKMKGKVFQVALVPHPEDL